VDAILGIIPWICSYENIRQSVMNYCKWVEEKVYLKKNIYDYYSVIHM
jgi:hypothetical protein